MTPTSMPVDALLGNVKLSYWPRLRVGADRAGLVGHAGSRLPASLAERSWLHPGLSKALAPW